jgi:ABC-2 type transport system ATP-binding protein
MINLENVSKSYEAQLFKSKKRVVNKISLEIKKGSITGFLGANGAGKSTIIKLIMGFISPDEGRIHFGSELGINKKSIFSKIGFLPERPFYYPHLTGREFLKYLGSLNKISPSTMVQRINDLSGKLELSSHLDKKVNNYSKGMLQRLGLIGSLIHDPMILILDEPLSGMDPLGRRIIKDMLLDLNENNKTIFFSSHILSDVEEICDRVVILDAGNLKYQGNKLDLFPVKNSFIVKVSGKLTPINKNLVIDLKYKAGNTYVEVLEPNLPEFLKDLWSASESIISINRKNSTMEEVIFGLSG